MTQGQGLNLYKVTSFFAISASLLAMGLVGYSIYQYSQQQPPARYVSTVDMLILNHGIAPAIVEQTAQQAPSLISFQQVQSALQQAGCYADFKDINLLTLSQRLATIQRTVEQQSQQYSHKAPYTLNVQTWANYSCQLLGQTEAVTQLAITASHIANTVRQVANSRMLLSQGNAYWCDKHPQKMACNTPNYAIQFSERMFAINNPWSGLKGCIVWGNAQQSFFLANLKNNTTVNQQLANHCAQLTTPKAAIAIQDQALTTLKPDDPSWSLPPSYADILQPIQSIRSSHNLYHQASADDDAQDLMANNTILINDKKRAIGLHTQLSIEPNTQSKAQQIALCYTGHKTVCEGLGIEAKQLKNQEFYEDAVVRKVGIVVLDINTGELQALASAHTTCFEQNALGLKGDKNCPLPSYSIKAAPDRLRNHAYFDQAPPASTTKPLIALALLQSSANRDIQNLGNELAYSDSDQFLRRLLCLNGQKNEACDLPQKTQQTAIALGWDSHCQAVVDKQVTPDNDGSNQHFICGQVDTLWGRTQKMDLGEANQELDISKSGLYGWFMVNKEGYPKTLRTKFDFVVDYNRPTTGKSWYTQQTYSVRELASQGLGQGESLSTPVGVAGMLANIVLAAQQQKQQILPHVITNIFDVNGTTPMPFKQNMAQSMPISINANDAHIVISKMVGSHQFGTARKACVTVFDKSTCQTLSTVAGKTGTPTIKDAENTQSAIAARQKEGKDCVKNCTYPPYKWYVAAYQSQGNPQLPYDKVIAVLVERNWTKSGHLTPDAANNHAAEIAFNVFKHLGVISKPSKPASQK